jgi:hypothetical protein
MFTLRGFVVCLGLGLGCIHARGEGGNYILLLQRM